MKKALILSISIVVLLIAASVIAAAREGHEGHENHGEPAAQKEAAPPKVFDAPQKEGVKATCPVTGDVLTIAKDTLHSEYKGKHVYFCCPDCKPKFDADPEKYLNDEKKAEPPCHHNR
jgi:YHS domain-containing protein